MLHLHLRGSNSQYFNVQSSLHLLCSSTHVCTYTHTHTHSFMRQTNTCESDGALREALNQEEEEEPLKYEYLWSDKGEHIVLGRGSFGAVYSAFDATTRRLLTVKEIPERVKDSV